MRSKAFVVLAAIAVLASGAWAQDCAKDTITVMGIGKVTAKPDVAYVTLLVKGDGVLMADAAQSVQKKIDDVEKAIKAKQPGTKDIVVTDVQVGQKGSPYSSDEAPRPEIVKQMRITIAPDPKAALDIIDAAIRAGASMETNDPYSYRGLSGSLVVYGLLKPEEAVAQARAKALEDAKSTADKTAAVVAKSVGEVTCIGSEGNAMWQFSFQSVLQNVSDYPARYVGADPSGIQVVDMTSFTFQLVKK